MGVVAAIGAIVAGTVSTGVAIHNANEAKDQAKAQADKQEATQNQLIQDAKDQQQQQKDEENAANVNSEQVRARNRQRMLASGSQGRQSTILTGPLGIPGDAAPAPAAGKSLLGI